MMMAHPMTALLASSISSLKRVFSRSRHVDDDVRAVLQEQAMQRMNPSATFRWDAIATASYVETRKAAVRARKLGKLHRDSI